MRFHKHAPPSALLNGTVSRTTTSSFVAWRRLLRVYPSRFARLCSKDYRNENTVDICGEQRVHAFGGGHCVLPADSARITAVWGGEHAAGSAQGRSSRHGHIAWWRFRHAYRDGQPSHRTLPDGTTMQRLVWSMRSQRDHCRNSLFSRSLKKRFSS